MSVPHVFASRIAQETHGFSLLRTTLADFAVIQRENIRKSAIGDCECAGFFDVADANGWRVTVPMLAEAAPSGKTSADTFEELWRIPEEALRNQGPFDAILWMLHGAMTVEGIDDPEGEIVTRTRAIVGSEPIIAVTLDAHANVSSTLVQCSDIVCGYRTTPHIDLRDTGRRAAELIRLALAGEVRPVTYSVHPPILVGLDHGRTTSPQAPVPKLQRMVARWQEGDPCLLDASFFSGFPFCDKPDAGVAAVIVVDHGNPHHERYLESLNQSIWEQRDFSSVSFHTMAEALEAARLTSGRGPFLIGDYSDTPHGGAYGDSPNALRTLVERGVQNCALGILWDPQAVSDAHRAGVGASVNVALGGRQDPSRAPPFSVCAEVTALSDEGLFTYRGPFMRGQLGRVGRSARLSIGSVDVVISQDRSVLVDREQFRLFGIDPEQKDLLVVKAYNHFRADFEPVGRGIMYVDTGGIFSFDLGRFQYKKARRPIFPLDNCRLEEGRTLRACSKRREAWE